MVKAQRTFSNFIYPDKNDWSVLDVMTFQSKNIFNSTIFHSTVYFKYKYTIFDDFIDSLNRKNIRYDFTNCPKHEITEIYRGKERKKMVYDDHIVKQVKKIQDKAIKFVFKNYQFYIDLYLKIIEHSKHNYPILLDQIFYYLFMNNIIINFNNLESLMLRFDRYDIHKDIKFDDDTFNEAYSKIIVRIINRIYRWQQWYYKFKFDSNVIEAVKVYLMQSSYDIKNENLYDFINSGDIKLTDQSIISRLVKEFNKNTLNKLPRDTQHDIIAKAYNAYSSYFNLSKINPLARKPNFLDKETGRYIIPVYKRNVKLFKYIYDDEGYLIKIDRVNNNDRLRNKDDYYLAIPTGRYIADNYKQITGNKKLVNLSKNNKSGHVFYVEKQFIDIPKPTNITQKDLKNLLKSHYQYKGKLIRKDDPNIIDAGYIFIRTCKKTVEKYKYLEISMDDNYNFKLNLTYEIVTKKTQPNINKIASIDLGTHNLITTYSPYCESIIISGGPVKSWNYYYGHKVDHLKSQIAQGNTIIKKTIKNTSYEKKYVKPDEISDNDDVFDKTNPKYWKQHVWKKKVDADSKQMIQDLRSRRMNKINDYFNMSAKYIVNNYCKNNEIDTLIIGYNKQWKNKVKMGRKNNRMFTSIPHAKLIKKIKDKAERTGLRIILQEESYTSKCDALSFEPIEHHNIYGGIRSKRGLYVRNNGQKINADINGAINIMRKAMEPLSEEIKKKLQRLIKKSNRNFGFLKQNPRKINLWNELKSESN
jgi:IS605 OrfB family transposase